MATACARVGMALLSLSGSAMAVERDVNVSLSWQPQALLRGAAPVRRLAMTGSVREALLRKHNELRAGVTEPCTAADMEVLAWDNGLAAAAESYAAQCVWGHDIAGNRANNWGENIAMQWNSIHDLSYSAELLTGMVQSWYDEIEDTAWDMDGSDGASGVKSKRYRNPQRKCKSPEGHSGECMIGHYTQVVWASTTRVGCGVAACDSGLGGDGGIYLVCKYTPPGNVVSREGDMPMPYTPGASCAACNGRCEGNLCRPGSVNRCEDRIHTVNMVFNGVRHSDCGSLISTTERFGRDYWCTHQEDKSKICQHSCQKCTPSAGLGPNFCGKLMNKAAITDLPVAADPPRASWASAAMVAGVLAGSVLTAVAAFGAMRRQRRQDGSLVDLEPLSSADE